MPYYNIRKGRPERYIIKQLRQSVCCRIPRKSNSLEGVGIQFKVWANHCWLIVRISIWSKERGRHERKIPAFKYVQIVPSSQEQVAKRHSDYLWTWSVLFVHRLRIHPCAYCTSLFLGQRVLEWDDGWITLETYVSGAAIQEDFLVWSRSMMCWKKVNLVLHY